MKKTMTHKKDTLKWVALGFLGRACGQNRVLGLAIGVGTKANPLCPKKNKYKHVFFSSARLVGWLQKQSEEALPLEGFPILVSLVPTL